MTKRDIKKLENTHTEDMPSEAFHFNDPDSQAEQSQGLTDRINSVKSLLDKITDTDRRKDVESWCNLAKTQIGEGKWTSLPWEDLLEIFMDPNDPDLEMLKQSIPAFREYVEVMSNIEETTPVPNSAVILSLDDPDEEAA